jgi:hypothetical protein
MREHFPHINSSASFLLGGSLTIYMSLEDILDTVTSLSRNVSGEEENLQDKEEMEKEYITHLSREGELRPR